MKSFSKGILKRSGCLPLIAVALSGCATVDPGPVIKAGDTVGVHFTCRLPNNLIAISSEKDIAADPVLRKAPFFLPRVTDGTLEVVAGTDKAVPDKGFEDDVMRAIAAGLQGLRAGESRTLELRSSAGSFKDLRLARVRNVEKEREVTVDEFKAHTLKDPEKGLTVQFEDSLPGVVKGIDDGKVTLAFSAPDGTTVHTPLGPGKVRDAGKQYEIVIDAKLGDLVRIGPLVGRVRFVDDLNIDFDFAKTFGGEDLRCDVLVETVKPMR